MKDGMTLVFVGVSWDPARRDLGGALEVARQLVREAGYDAGEFDLEQLVGPGEAVGCLEMSEALYCLVEEEGDDWERREDDVCLGFSTP